MEITCGSLREYILLPPAAGTWILTNKYPIAQVVGPIVIEDNWVIGQNAILFPNIRFGEKLHCWCRINSHLGCPRKYNSYGSSGEAIRVC